MARPPTGRLPKPRKEEKQPSSTSNDKTSSSGNTSRPSGKQHLSPPSAFDGNRDPSAPRSRGNSATSHGSQQGVPPSGQQAAAGSSSDQAPTNFNRNIDYGFYASCKFAGHDTSKIPARPKEPNPNGREVVVKLNTFNVLSFPTKKVYQYDVKIGNGLEKRGLVKRIWKAKTLQAKLGPGWIFDGVALAWSMDKKDEVRDVVDMDAENEREPRIDRKTGEPKPDKHRVLVTRSGEVQFDVLRHWLENRAAWDTRHCLQALDVCDRLLRETPSSKFTVIKRNFFARGQRRELLGGGLEAFRGVYATVRPVHGGWKMPARLSVNVDVANTAFYTETPLCLTAKDMCEFADVHQMENRLLPDDKGKPPPQFKILDRLRKIYVYTTYRGEGKDGKDKQFMIDRFLPVSAEKHKIEVFNSQTNKKEWRTIKDFFMEKYGMRLTHPKLPVVQMTKKAIVLPMELCFIAENQRYPYKLSEKQTTKMISFAVNPPNDRWAHIKEKCDMLSWGQDRYLANYGLQISPDPVKVKARVLPNPTVQFRGKDKQSSHDPGTSGRWDLRGKVFFEPNVTPLKSWGVCILPGRGAPRVEEATVFMSKFIEVYKRHGGRVENTKPLIMQGNAQGNVAAEHLYNAVGNQHQLKPQLLVFIVPNKDSAMYARLKRSADCRFGIVSQVMQAAHVFKGQDQYMSNVCMKVNAKLGGCTAHAVGKRNLFKEPTLIIGADVSHGAAYDRSPVSIAALTMSRDRQMLKYVAGVETNGSRVEMITKDNMKKLLTPMFNAWMQSVNQGKLPEHVIYFRDGVSEGQYAKVLNEEVKDIKGVLASIDPKKRVKFTVVIASKRHHVRFFPEHGDKNGNALPGTLVETGVTHPFEFDFYLCAHNALKGTARPVHYHVLLDEADMDPTLLQAMIYEASYQYVRSTTPVSLFPAVYYAHLAASRATSHIKDPAASSGEQPTTRSSSAQQASEVEPLLPLQEGAGIEGTMWYV